MSVHAAEMTEQASQIRRDRTTRAGGSLIVNADDWGLDRRTSDMILDCVRLRAVSAVSAMVFMDDSERAARLALDHRIDAGLHLNLTERFSQGGMSPRLVEHQQRIARYLLRHRLAQAVFNPQLSASFKYVVESQVEEFRRLYGAEPARFDGHHHMHLSANVLLGGLLPSGTLVRRSFTFEAGEKSLWNRTYRRFVDAVLRRRHRTVDFFYSLAPLEPPSRLDRIFSLARDFVIELETHPVNPTEHRFLAGGEIFARAGDARISPPPRHGCPT